MKSFVICTLYRIHYYVIQSNRMRLTVFMVRMEKLNAYRVSVGKPEGKGPLGRPRNRWRGNVEMCLKKYDERERTGLI